MGPGREETIGSSQTGKVLQRRRSLELVLELLCNAAAADLAVPMSKCCSHSCPPPEPLDVIHQCTTTVCCLLSFLRWQQPHSRAV